MGENFRIGTRTLVEVLMPKTHILKGNIVMLRLESDYGYVNTWWEIMRFDQELNGEFSFTGKLVKKHYEYTKHKLGEYSQHLLETIQDVLRGGEIFCYSDNVTVCNCKGLCRNNY